MLTIETFTQWANELGFGDVGFCSPEAFMLARQIVNKQAPLRERRQLHFSPEEDIPQIKSLAVLLWPYVPVQDDEDAIFVDSYYQASNAAYHAARTLEKRLLDAGRFARANVSYPAKEAAIRAGLGLIGMNSLLITPQYGSRVVIILMATDIEIEKNDREYEKKTCFNCGKCAAACPAHAIDHAGLTHPERCLRNYMMEGVVVPEHLRKAGSMRLIGCDICQRVCPLQQTPPEKRPEPYHLREFVTEDAAAFSDAVQRLSEEIGRNTARPQRVRAQTALLAGNTKDSSYLPVLRQWAQSPFDAVREHALWAIEQIELTGNKT